MHVNPLWKVTIHSLSRMKHVSLLLPLCMRMCDCMHRCTDMHMYPHTLRTRRRNCFSLFICPKTGSAIELGVRGPLARLAGSPSNPLVTKFHIYRFKIFSLDGISLCIPGCPGTLCAYEDDLNPLIFLALSLQCWDYVCAPAHSVLQISYSVCFT